MVMGPLDADRRQKNASEAGISDWRRPYTEEEMIGGLPSRCNRCDDAGCRHCDDSGFEPDGYDDEEAITREENAYERYIFQD